LRAPCRLSACALPLTVGGPVSGGSSSPLLVARSGRVGLWERASAQSETVDGIPHTTAAAG
jgi:hypothetical protein